jgi:hypothetical protein
LKDGKSGRSGLASRTEIAASLVSLRWVARGICPVILLAVVVLLLLLGGSEMLLLSVVGRLLLRLLVGRRGGGVGAELRPRLRWHSDESWYRG